MLARLKLLVAFIDRRRPSPVALDGRATVPSSSVLPFSLPYSLPLPFHTVSTAAAARGAAPDDETGDSVFLASVCLCFSVCLLLSTSVFGLFSWSVSVRFALSVYLCICLSVSTCCCVSLCSSFRLCLFLSGFSRVCVFFSLVSRVSLSLSLWFLACLCLCPLLSSACMFASAWLSYSIRMGLASAQWIGKWTRNPIVVKLLYRRA